MSVTVVVCVTPPPLPVIVIVRVPVVALRFTVTVIVDVPEPGAAIELGLKLTLTRDPWPLADKPIAELKPPEIAVVIVDLPEVPRVTVSDVGEAPMVKFGFVPVTVSRTVVYATTSLLYRGWPTLCGFGCAKSGFPKSERHEISILIFALPLRGPSPH